MEDFQMLYWYWLVFGMILMLLELAVPSFTIFWFGLGALVVGVLLLVVPGLSLTLQVLVWIIASAAFVLFWFKVLKPRMTDKTTSGIAREAVLGETAMVTRVPEGDRRGEIRFSVPMLGSDTWPFICDDEVAVGDRVAVREISGNTMLVKKVTFIRSKQKGGLNMGGLIVVVIFAILVITTISMGVRLVPQGSKWVVQRLGKYHKTLNPA